MRFPIFLILTSFLMLSIFAEIKCPKCGTINSDDDRYCLNCAAKIRKITPEEEQALKSHIIKKQETVAPAHEEKKEKASVQPEAPIPEGEEIPFFKTGETTKYYLYLIGDERYLTLGYEKNILRNWGLIPQFKFEKYKDSNTITFGTDSDPDRNMTIRLYYNNDKLTEWYKKIENKQIYIRHNPVSSNRVEKGDKIREVLYKWGPPDIKIERYNEKCYGLVLFYFLNKPVAAPSGEQIKKGKAVKLVFNEAKVVDSVSEIESAGIITCGKTISTADLPCCQLPVNTTGLIDLEKTPKDYTENYTFNRDTCKFKDYSDG